MRPRDLEPGNRRHRASLHLDVARSTSWLPNGKHSNVLPQRLTAWQVLYGPCPVGAGKVIVNPSAPSLPALRSHSDAKSLLMVLFAHASRCSRSLRQSSM